MKVKVIFIEKNRKWRLLLRFYVTIFFQFPSKISKKKKFFFEAQIQRISKVFAPQTGNEGFYCVFKWQFFQFSSKISKKKKKIFRKMVQAWSAGYFVIESDPILADRFLLLFYVTIFSHFKPNKQFINKNSENFQGFYNPNRKCNSWQGFYCVFMWQYFQISSKISNFSKEKIILRILLKFFKFSNFHSIFEEKLLIL